MGKKNLERNGKREKPSIDWRSYVSNIDSQLGVLFHLTRGSQLEMQQAKSFQIGATGTGTV